MKAHERTETWLHQHRKEIDFTILREGLYNESWPLYFGHYDIGKDSRSEILVAGDGPISWTSIPDLGLANAAILAAPRDQWNDKTCYLSHAATHTLNDVASMVSAAVGREVKLQVSPRAAYEKFYEQERDVDGGHVTWWSKTYDALEAGECGIRDSTLEKILEGFDTKPKDLRTTIKGMLNPTSPRP
jgi:nucleoside-diphosphate-sugar epimerase